MNFLKNEDNSWRTDIVGKILYTDITRSKEKKLLTSKRRAEHVIVIQ